MLIFAFMHHPYLVCIPFGMPSLHLFTFLFSCYFTSGWVGTCFIHEVNRELSTKWEQYFILLTCTSLQLLLVWYTGIPGDLPDKLRSILAQAEYICLQDIIMWFECQKSAIQVPRLYVCTRMQSYNKGRISWREGSCLLAQGYQYTHMHQQLTMLNAFIASWKTQCMGKSFTLKRVRDEWMKMCIRLDNGGDTICGWDEWRHQVCLQEV